MFYLLDFEHENVAELQFELSGSPNGTIWDKAVRIRVPNLPTNHWIVWTDKEYTEDYAIAGIHVRKLDIQQSIYDKDWTWDDTFLNNIFL